MPFDGIRLTKTRRLEIDVNIRFINFLKSSRYLITKLGIKRISSQLPFLTIRLKKKHRSTSLMTMQIVFREERLPLHK